MIEIPQSLRNTKRVKIIIKELSDNLESKVALLKKSKDDPFFLADMNEVNKDFQFIESKIVE